MSDLPKREVARMAERAPAISACNGSHINYLLANAMARAHAGEKNLPAHPQARQNRIGIGVGFLPVDAPVAQLLQRNWLAGHGAAHISARSADAEVAVEILDLRLRGAEIAIHSIHQSLAAW